MSEVLTARERDWQEKYKQKENELKQATLELEERGKLLYKTKVAIEQLQQELAASRKHEESIREEAARVCEEQEAQLHEAEDHIVKIEEDLSAESKKSQALQARIQLLEDELDSARSDNHHSHTASDSQLKDKDQTIELLQEELQSAQEQMSALDRLMKERASSFVEKASQLQTQRDESERLVKELMAKNTQLQEECQRLQLSMKGVEDKLVTKEESLKDAMITQELSKKELAALERDWSRKMGKAEADWSQKLADSQKKLELMDKEWSLKFATAQQSSAGVEQDLKDRLRESEREWERRLQEGMREFELKFTTERQECEKRVSELEKQWLVRIQENESLWSTQLQEEQQAWENEKAEMEKMAVQQRQELDKEYARHMEGLKTEAEKAALNASHDKSLLENLWSKKLEDAERHCRKKLDETTRECSQKVEEVRQQALLEKDVWTSSKQESERKWLKKLEDSRKRTQDLEGALEASWKQKFEAANQRWLKERDDLEQGWMQRMSEVQTAAQERYELLRTDLESKVQSITERLTEMAKREAKREKKRAELVQQVEELTVLNDEEFRKRCELERGLREAAALFKKELYEKEEELESALSELRTFKEWDAHLSHSSCPHPLRSSGPPSPTVQHTTTHHGPISSASTATCSPRQLDHQYTAPAPSASVRHSTANSAVERELRALRLAREEYQHALLEQERVRNKLLSSIEKKLEERELLASVGARSPVRTSPHASTSPKGRAFIGGRVSTMPLGRFTTGSRRSTGRSPRSQASSRTYYSPHKTPQGLPLPSSTLELDDTTDTDGTLDFDTWHERLTRKLGGAIRNLEPDLN